MSWRKKKEVVVLTNLLAFATGLVFLLLSRHYFTTEALVTIFGLLGSYLTISIVVNLFHTSFIRPSEDEARDENLKKLLDQRINSILGNSAKYGFAGFIPEMDFKGLFNSLESGDTLWWLDTYCPGHGLWEDELRRAISRGALIHMLVLSPDSRYAEDRAREIGGTYTPQRFKNELGSFREALEIIRTELQAASGHVEIVEYTDRPGMPVYLVVKKDGGVYGYSSLFLGKPTGVAFPHMRWIMAEVGVVQQLLDYVQAKWRRNAKTVEASERG